MNKLFDRILQESFNQEHLDAVKLASKNFESWLDLIIWDLLEIQEISKQLTEANLEQKLQHCLKTLKEDIEILECQVGDNPPIFYLQSSNTKMINLVGYINETRTSLNEENIGELNSLIEKMKIAIHNYIDRTGNSLYGFIQASKLWNKLPQAEKYKRIHEIDVNAEKEFDENGVSLKA